MKTIQPPDIKNLLIEERLPKHVAIIMDGNGRWAKEKGKFRIFGHKSGVNAVREVCEAAAEIGIKYLTLYAFSTENWNRPQVEVNALMSLLVSTIKSETKTLMENNIKLEAIGNLESLPKECLKQLKETQKITSENTRMTLVLALSYSARWDMVQAVKKISNMVKSGNLDSEMICEDTITKNLTTASYPSPELMIRTSGELRISNFLLWEIAYSEMYFTDVLWPDFTRHHFYVALLDYQNRERRFGKTSEQLKK